jgi:hypothetical protein
VEMSLQLHPNGTPPLFYCRPPQAPSRPPTPRWVPSQWHVPVNGQELLNVRECSVSSQSSRRWLSVRYQRFLLIAGDREVQSLRRSEMRKHPFFKPTSVAAIGRTPLVMVYGWGLFG